MTQDDLIAALPPGRLPDDLMHLAPLDVLALFGAGLVAAAMLSALVMPFVRRRPSRRVLIRSTRGRPAGERILAIARILGRMPDPLRAAAYGAEPAPSDTEIESIALKGGRRWR